MKNVYPLKNKFKKAFAFILFSLLCSVFVINAQPKKVFFITKGDNITSTGATHDSSLIDSLSHRFQVRKWTYTANLTIDDSLSLDSAGVIVVSRNLSSGMLINTATTAAWWSRRPVPIIYLPVQMISNNRCKMINAGSSVTKSWTNNGRIRPRDLVIKAHVTDINDPAFQGVTITNGMVDYFNWIYETVNMDSATFVLSSNGNYGKLLATAYDPDTASTNHKILMVRWSPGDSAYRGSGIKVANYRTYMEFGTDQSSFRHFNNYQAQSIQILANEIKNVCPDIALATALPKNIAKNKGANIFPNPVVNKLTVSLDKLTPETNISVYKLNGSLVMQVKPYNKQTVLNVSNLPSGIYLLKINTKEGVITKQIIKM